jgi:hypothetical protein
MRDIALKGITAAYFVYPIKVPGILEATAFFAQAALEQGVGAIVNMSQITARRIAKSHAAQNHWIAECFNSFILKPALPATRSTVSVAINPGATELTRMACFANSSASLTSWRAGFHLPWFS